MAEERKDPMNGLMPMLAKQLRELRIESGDLYARLDALEKELEKERARERDRAEERERKRLAIVADYVPWTDLSAASDAPINSGDVIGPDDLAGSDDVIGDDDPLFQDLDLGEDLDFSTPNILEPPRPASQGGRRVAQEPVRDSGRTAVQESGRAAQQQQQQQKPKSPAGRILRVVGNVFFFAAIVALFVGAYLIRSTQDGAPFGIGGYSGMLVLSGSMQDVIPKGSFILTKSVDTNTLKVGDDITYMLNASTTVTHRIINIRPQTDGSLAFQTQGVNNTTPDSALVASSNVVGKVVYHNYTLGLAATSIRDNWPLLLFLMIVFMVLCRVLAHIQQSDDGDEKTPEQAGARTA